MLNKLTNNFLWTSKQPRRQEALETSLPFKRIIVTQYIWIVAEIVV